MTHDGDIAMVMVATNYSSHRNVFLAICGMIILTYGTRIFDCTVSLAYSNVRQSCPPEGVAPVNVVVNKTINQTLHHDTTHPFVPSIAPDHCGSPLRGLEFDMIYANGKWFKGKTLRRPNEFYSDANWPPKDIQKLSASGAGSDRGDMQLFFLSKSSKTPLPNSM